MAEVIGIVTIGATDYPVSAMITLPELPAPEQPTLLSRIFRPGRKQDG